MLPLTMYPRHTELTPREEAETILGLGDDLVSLLKAFDRDFNKFSSDIQSVFNRLQHIEFIDSVAIAIRQLGRDLNTDCDRREEAADNSRLTNVGGHRDGGSAS